MNNKFLAAALLLTAVTATPSFASHGIKNIYENNRSIVMNASVKKIVITGNVDVVLITDGTTDILIDGKPDISKGIKLVYEKNQLEIIAPQYTSKKRPVIQVPASFLQAIEINGDGDVYSAAYINSPDLEIFVNGACHINIRSTGKIVVKASPDYEINYSRNRQFKPEL